MRAIETGKNSRPETVNPGPAPMLHWIRIENLVIDDSYQRELKQGNWNAIRRIAKGFKWSLFSPLFVAPIEGGKFAIVDGQHRTHAAAICGFSEAPCQIVQMSREEQAAAFAVVNGEVTRVTAWQIYKAALTAGEAWAVAADWIASQGGCRLMTNNASSRHKKPGEIYGVNTFRQIIDARSSETVVKALQVLMRAEGYRDAPEIWDMNVLSPLLLALSARPDLLDNAALASRLENFDIWAAIDKIVAGNKNRVRMGLPYASKKEQLESLLGDWLERQFGPAGAVNQVDAREANHGQL